MIRATRKADMVETPTAWFDANTSFTVYCEGPDWKIVDVADGALFVVVSFDDGQETHRFSVGRNTMRMLARKIDEMLACGDPNVMTQSEDFSDVPEHWKK